MKKYFRVVGKEKGKRAFYVHYEEYDIYDFPNKHEAASVCTRLSLAHPDTKYKIVKEGRYLDMNRSWCCLEIELEQLQRMYNDKLRCEA